MTQPITIVLGASANPERYANKAIKSLIAHGHKVIPVNPALDAVEGLPVVKSLEDITGPIHTITLYLSPERSTPLIEQIVQIRPERVIMNPGTENPILRGRLDREGIRRIEACTLVLLATGQWESA